MSLVSNDEDVELFLDELQQLLQKYHYDLSPFTLRKITDLDIIIGGWFGNGKDGIFYPEYFRLKTNENE